ncbi:transposase [Nocardia aurea]|uniref:transposase n=1 Tax=Nocardia aurea TaxID=2144174 RepID=UPI001E490BD0|nr:transposase [Nocardia aurea]
MTGGNGFPIVVELSAANVNDHLMLAPVLDRVRPWRGRPGPPRRRIKTLIGDKGYDYPSVYAELRQRGITGYIPRRGTRDKVTAGRWIVEQTFALLHQYRRLAVRWERCTDIHYGVLNLAAALITQQPNPIGALHWPCSPLIAAKDLPRVGLDYCSRARAWRPRGLTVTQASRRIFNTVPLAS